MPKKPAQPAPKPAPKPAAALPKAPPKPTPSSPELSWRQLLWLGVGLTLVYVLGSLISPGFYQHDEAAHYSSMRGFWSNPNSVLGAWHKPGYKVLYAVPSLLGPTFVMVTNAAVAALTVVLTILLASRLGLKQPLVAGALLAFQPIWAQLAWRNYAELPSAAVLVGVLLLHYSDRRVAAALLASYLVTLRQELYPVVGLYGLWLLYRREWIPAFSLAVFPLLLNAWGWWATGDPLFVPHQLLNTQAAFSDAYIRHGGEHYPLMSLTTFGAIALVSFATYCVLALRREVRWEWMVLAPLVTYFALHSLFNASSFKFGPSQGGNLRYMTVIAPLVSVLGAVGLEKLSRPADRRAVTYVLIALALVTALFMSYEHNLVKLTDEWTFGPLFTVLIAGTLVLVPRGAQLTLAGVLIISVMSIALTGKRLKLTTEEKAVQDAVRWAKREKLESKPAIATHSMFFYFYGKPAMAVPNWSTHMTDSTLAAAAPGTLVLWDSHYSYRSSMNYPGQVDLNWFQQRPKEYPLERQFVASDQRFGLFVFRKQAVAPADTSRPMR